MTDRNIAQDDGSKTQPKVVDMTVQIPDATDTDAPHVKTEHAEGIHMRQAIDKINLELKEKAVVQNAKTLDLTYVDITQTPINPDMFNLLDDSIMAKTLVLPFFKIGKKIRVAVSDPNDTETKNVLQKLRDDGYQLNVSMASDTGIRNILGRYFSKTAKQTVNVDNTEVDESKLEAYAEEIKNLGKEAEETLSEMPAEEGVNFLCVGAIKTGSSDMHFQPEEGYCQLRFRIDGMMQPITRIDLKTYANLLNQLKYKAKMKLNINNEPQDGRFYFVINDQKIDVRVSLIPTEFGETIVMRLLDARKGFLSLKELGFSDFNYSILEKLCHLSTGLILVTGPTGSGKTTTLYGMLDRLNKQEVKIITLEDPIEYHLHGISQSQVNEKRGYTFASGLKSILRQDPNIVMIGEIRDLDTASTTCQAALTGHLVLSTLHTNSAVESIPRMLNIGVPEFMLAPTLRAVAAQRLVRILCECKTEKELEEKEKIYLEEKVKNLKEKNPDMRIDVPTKLYKPVGCAKCSDDGYRGQTQIAEILIIDDDIHDMILDKKSGHEILGKAIEKGMITMEDDGVIKVIQSITTLEEVFRVIDKS
ncbi:MAG: GspE/PulE family protein [Candidatus Peregrinibacteria bacterium]|nr:GspE/PulE family protein [Candidatus Peregrinibacteria bacterium]MDZ4244708.1 GspE/PulE family protein [Candidatus Gracilibacteria bacterium]